jgi:type III pantothenate kinase
MACIVIDIGNTSTAIGLAEAGKVRSVSHLQGGLRDRAAIGHVVRGIAGETGVTESVLCSVVPASNRVWQSELKRLLGRAPLVVTHRLELGVDIDYPKPATIGADRLANACAAVARYGAPAIVADFGTALTFDVISGARTYIGGVIAPGLPLMTDYLAEKTALLPHIRLQGTCRKVGKSTKGAMRIGAKIGYQGMVRGIVDYLTRGLEMDGVSLCATGGYARWALEGIGLPFKVDPVLTLFGLARIHELNRR